MKILFFILFFIIISFSGSGQTKAELEDRKNSTLREIEMAKELLDKTESQKESTIKKVAVLNRGINSRANLISNINEEIGLLDQQINDLESEIKNLDANIRKGKDEYAKIIYAIYKNHTEEEKMMYLLASDDINQFYQRIKYLKYLKDYRERKVIELESLMAEKETRSDEMLRVRNEKGALLQEKESENRVLVRERNHRNNMIMQLAQEGKQIRKQIEEKERIRKELEEKIRKLIEEEARKSSSNTLVTSLTPEQKLIGNSFLQNKGRLPWPVERGIITAEFGLIDHPVLKGVKISNNGIDISTTPGSMARAVFDGEVSRVFAILGANYVVIIMHGEYLSVYQNLVDLEVKAGDKVTTKQVLGKIHADAVEDMAVLHLQVWKSKEIVDPKLWLSK